MENLSSVELGKLLEEHRIAEEVVDAILDNEVTGECFLLLTEQEIKELAPKIGDRVKLRQLISKCEVSSCGMLLKTSHI